METNTTDSVLTVRRLMPDEYGLLEKVAEGFCPDPNESIAIIAQSGAVIVGRMLLLCPFHIEGTWIEESYRHRTVAVRLIAMMEREARKIGLSKIFSYAPNAEIEGYLSRLGYKKQPLTVWTKEL